MLISIGTLLFSSVVMSPSAMAASSPWIEEEYSRVRLVSGQETLGEQGNVMLGLQFELVDGWKTYWRSPGDAGFPVSLDLAESENLDSWKFNWPVPHRFTLFGLQTFGYSKEVVFPFQIQAKDPAKDVFVRGKLSYLLCQEICIPFDTDVNLRLPAGDAFPSLEEGIVNAYMKQVPGLGAEKNLQILNSNLVGDGEDLRLLVMAGSTVGAFSSPDVIVEGPPGFSFSKPDVKVLDGGAKAEFSIPVKKGKETKGVLEGKKLTLTLVDGTRGLESLKIAQYAAGPVNKAVSFGALLPILAVALLGGFILNLMPCVLPVLSLKLMSVVKHGDSNSSSIRSSFIAVSLGIITSFWILAAAAISLKYAGFSVGWGIQFQQPIFLIVMSGIVSLFAANLFGWFEFLVPSGVMNKAVGASDQQGRSGDFLKGMFATLLATPCSAPFLGTAVGFALARGTVEIVAIFTFLGLGMSLPYLAVAARPRLASILPKPGKWMVWLKVILGLMLLGTTVWLLSVLFAQVGLTATLIVAGLLSLGLLILAFKEVSIGKRAFLVALVAFSSLVVPTTFAVAPQKRVASEMWKPFGRDAIADHVKAGKVVFVDVTADWCITCQVNKKLVLDQDEIQDWLKQDNVIPMLADWTLPSEAITAYLESYDRFGIPFNIVYGPEAPDGIVLSELLTLSETLEAFRIAKGIEN